MPDKRNSEMLWIYQAGSDAFSSQRFAMAFAHNAIELLELAPNGRVNATHSISMKALRLAMRVHTAVPAWSRIEPSSTDDGRQGACFSRLTRRGRAMPLQPTEIPRILTT